MLKVVYKCILLVIIFLLSLLLWIHTTSNQRSLQNEKKSKIENDTNKKQKKDTSEQDANVTVTRQDGTVLKLDMEQYLRGVVGSEMPASFEMEALKAQAVAARTFVMKREFRVDDTTRTQVYNDDEQMRNIWGKNYDTYSKRINIAVEETKGQYLTYKGNIISAVFFSGSSGKTANAEEYWENKIPYLRSVDSHWDKKEKGYEQQVSFSEDEFAKKLGFKQKIQQLGAPQYYASGYVNSITIDNIKFSGRKFRELLNLRSSSFQIKKEKQRIVITTKGYGHGIGMSQYGAQGMALEGSSYQDILKHYYTGVKIET